MKRELSFIILITIIILGLTTIKAMETQLIAHRTNTIEKIEKAITIMKKPFVEIDVRKHNNQFIASHDKNPKNITTIKQILTKFKNKTKFQFDLKEQNHEIEFTSLVLKNLKPDQFIITSKYIDSLKKIKNNNKNISLGLIISKKNPFIFTIRFIQSHLSPASLINQASKEGFIIFPEHRFVTKNFLKTAKKHNTEIIPWTVNTKDNIKNLESKKQIKAIITDNIELTK